MYVAWGESTLDMTWRGPVKVTLIVTGGLSVSTMHVEWDETTYVITAASRPWTWRGVR